MRSRHDLCSPVSTNLLEPTKIALNNICMYAGVGVGVGREEKVRPQNFSVYKCVFLGGISTARKYMARQCKVNVYQ